MRVLTTPLHDISGGLYRKFSCWATLFDSTSSVERDFIADRLTYTPVRGPNYNKEGIVDIIQDTQAYADYCGHCRFHYNFESMSIFEITMSLAQWGYKL